VSDAEKLYEECTACDDCGWSVKTDDPYATGDSPTVWECEVDDIMNCPCVDEGLLL
jgi:hypothetical protein